MNKKMFFIFSGLFLIVLLGITGFSLLLKIIINKRIEKVNKESVPYFSLFPSKGEFKSGEIINLKVILNTGGKNVSAAGIIINYENNLIKPEIINQGNLFGFYLNNKIDKEKGEIKITGLAFDNKKGRPGKPFSGKGDFAQINFRVLPLDKKTKTQVKIYFLDFGSTIDSNIMEAETAKDILRNVNKAEFSLLP